METIYDTIILGGGAAGFSASIYTARYNLKTLVIAKEIGGTTNLAHEIENWPGFIGSGIELMNNFKEHSEKLGVEIVQTEIVSIEKEDNLFIIKDSSKSYVGKTIIITLGSEHRKLNIPGEEEFLGKGVSYCATCDGTFFRNKEVMVIGGANSAASAALYLSTMAKKVYISYRKEKMRCEPISLEKLKKRENVEFIYNSIPLKILGDSKTNKIKLSMVKSNEENEIEIDGVFIEIGSTPLTKLVEELGIKINLEGYIEVDREMRTSLGGVFAAGDITNNVFKQVVTAAGDGAIAAKSAYEYLDK